MTEDQHSLESTNSSKVDKENLANKKMTFEDFDKLNLKSFGKDIVKIIENDKTLSNDQNSCTISLNADFGQGKTTFLEMLKDFIERQNSGKYTALFIDAWRGDFFKEPIITILSEFLEYLEKNGKVENKQDILKTIGKVIYSLTRQEIKQDIGIDLKNIFKRILIFIFKITPIFIRQILKKHIGIDLKEARKEIKEEKLGEALFSKFKQRKQVLQEIKNIISNYTKNGKKLVVIVDELDRARPDYAVHFLEDMKHFFDIKNVVFIFGINKRQIKATVETLYGQDLEFEGYYKKFFKHERNLPDPYKEAISFIKSLLKQTKVTSELKSANIHFLFKSFKLTLRDLSRFIELCDVILSKTAEDDERNYKYSNSVLFFICLLLKKQDIFNKVLNNEFNLDDFLSFIDEAKIPYHSDEEKIFLAEAAYSFLLKSQYERSDFISIGTKPQQQIEDFESGVEKIKTKFEEEYSMHKVFSYLFDSQRSYIIKKQPCLIICNAIQHGKPFYANKSGFQKITP